MGYWKHFIAGFGMPLSVCLVLLTFGVLLLWWTRWQKTGKIFVSVGMLVLLLFSYGLGISTLTRGLERWYSPLIIGQGQQGDFRSLSLPVRWVVVLAGGLTVDPALPKMSWLSSTTLVRLVEGVQLYRRWPGTRLVVSGGVRSDTVSEADAMAQVAMRLGVAKANIVVESDSFDTCMQAQSLGAIVGEDSFFLVTSAVHMPRSMMLFEKQGLRPFPVPVGHLVKDNEDSVPWDWFPNAEALVQADQVLHEVFGIAWIWVRPWFGGVRSSC